jgi:hypothetical protein
MSALGQKRTHAVQQRTSAKGQKRTSQQVSLLFLANAEVARIETFDRSRLPGGGISRSDFILTYSVISPF